MCADSVQICSKLTKKGGQSNIPTLPSPRIKRKVLIFILTRPRDHPDRSALFQIKMTKVWNKAIWGTQWTTLLDYSICSTTKPTHLYRDGFQLALISRYAPLTCHAARILFYNAQEKSSSRPTLFRRTGKINPDINFVRVNFLNLVHMHHYLSIGANINFVKKKVQPKSHTNVYCWQK